MISSNSPTKKPLTEDAHTSSLAANQPPNTYVDNDLRSRLRNRASRVRKSVMEGYSTNCYESNPTPVDASDVSIFRSARDINQRIFISGIVSPFSSPKKRDRLQYEGHDATSDEIAEDIDIEMQDAGITTPDEKDSIQATARPIKPLPRTQRLVAVPQFPTGQPDRTDAFSKHPMPQLNSLDPQNDPFLD